MFKKTKGYSGGGQVKSKGYKVGGKVRKPESNAIETAISNSLSRNLPFDPKPKGPKPKKPKPKGSRSGKWAIFGRKTKAPKSKEPKSKESRIRRRPGI